jgi:tungstate transport system ATP-binding protein
MGTAAPASVAALEARDLVVERAARELVRVDRLALARGETLAILGPNGAGKTTLLLALATLIESRGTLLVEGRPPSRDFRRRIAVVFQRPLLLDSSARENAALGLAIRGLSRDDQRRRGDAAMTQLGIAHLAERRARTLSGGEAQRVSLARALALEPEILFLDEPFTGLDAPAREALIADLARALRARAMTTLLVTHDREEAISLADRVAILLAGRIRQLDTPERVFATPSDPEVAAFVGVENILPSRVIRVDEEITRLAVADRIVEVTATPPPGESFPLVGIPPDDIVVSREAVATSARNTFRARIVRVEPIGRRVRVVVDCGFPLVAHVTHRSARDLALGPGDEIVASFKATTPHLLPRHRRSATAT